MEYLHLAIGRPRQKPHLIRSFFAQAGLATKEYSFFRAIRRGRFRVVSNAVVLDIRRKPVSPGRPSF
jgi:hypothetical protein